MKILATGANGMVGSYLADDVVKTDIDTLDVNDRAQVRDAIEEHKPDVFLHLAAETDVDLCEVEPDRAYITNALGTRNVALETAAADVPLVYISTAGVFLGDKQDPYHEYDIPAPANHYGHSKLAGEQYVRQFAPKSYICRAGWMIGGGPDGEKKFIAKMLDRASQTGSIMAVNDKWGSPTYGKHLIAGIRRLVETEEYGLYHMVNEGFTSRYDIAVLVNEILGSPYEVLPVSSANFPLPAPRARSEAMENMLLRLKGWDWMPDWRDAITEYLGDEWSGWSARGGTLAAVPAPASSG